MAPDIEYRTEYNLDGFYLLRGARNTDGSTWVTRYSYDPSGRLLEIVCGNGSEPSAKTTYSYDDQGRLLRIADSQTSESITFRYDGGWRTLSGIMVF